MPVAFSHHCVIRLPIVPGLSARPLSVVRITSTPSLAKSSRTFEMKTSEFDFKFSDIVRRTGPLLLPLCLEKYMIYFSPFFLTRSKSRIFSVSWGPSLFHFPVPSLTIRKYGTQRNCSLVRFASLLFTRYYMMSLAGFLSTPDWKVLFRYNTKFMHDVITTNDMTQQSLISKIITTSCET